MYLNCTSSTKSSSSQKIWSSDQQLLDRYVPPRIFRPHQPLWNVCDLVNDAEETDNRKSRSVFNQCLGNRGRTEYRRLLAATLFQDMSNFGDRVLPLWRASHSGGPNPAPANMETDTHYWPVRPRSSPRVGKPRRILELPSLARSTISPQPLAWGKNDMLAAAVGPWVSVWRGDEGVDSGLKLDMANDHVVSVAWCFADDTSILAVGTRRGFLQVWDCTHNKKVAERLGYDFKVSCVLVWHPVYLDRIVAGTISGGITVYTACLTTVCDIISTIHVRVTQLCFSPGGSLLASGGNEGSLALWSWPDIDLLMSLDTRASLMAISWHPWKEKMVAAGSLHGEITLANLASLRKATASYSSSPQDPCVLTSLSFAPRTGELVVAYRAGAGPNRERATHLVVLENFYQVVDRLEMHDVPVRCLQWSPDGAVLASVSIDRLLFLWNFLGEKNTRRIRKEVATEARERRQGIHQQFGCVIR